MLNYWNRNHRLWSEILVYIKGYYYSLKKKMLSRYLCQKAVCIIISHNDGYGMLFVVLVFPSECVEDIQNICSKGKLG